MNQNIEIIEKVILHPNELTGNLNEHILDNLIKKYQGKCIKDGYIVKIVKIVDRSLGEISLVDFDSNTNYIVKFLANVSYPKENDVIKDCLITLVNSIGIFAEKDFLTIIITSNNLDKGYEKKYKTGNKLNISVNKIKFELNDKKIRVLGKVIT
jgi:DNA-directed RNA polymerase subunit E'/Rpb7